MLIAQISDTHVKAPGERLFGTMNTYGMLHAALERIGAHDPRPDLVIVTGDLTADGLPEEYAALRKLLEPLPMPWLLIPGNHDDRANLRAAFPEQPWSASGEFLHYVFDAAGLRLIALDTVVPGAPGGRLCAARLDWLAARLAEAPDRPTAIMMHHPPFLTGIAHMDGMGLENPADLAGILVEHAQVVRILCGHIHRPIQTMLSGVPVSVAPSTCFQVELRLHARPGITLTREPPAYQLHMWGPQNGLVSHTAYVEDYGVWERPPAP